MRGGRRLELAQIGVAAADEMEKPRKLGRGACPEELLRLTRLIQGLAGAAQIAERLRGPHQRARETIVVAPAAQLLRRLAVMREGAFVVTADPVQQAPEQDDPGKLSFRVGRESVEPPLKRRDLTRFEHSLSVIADELRCATVIAGFLKVMDRAVGISPRHRAVRVGPMQLDDLRGGEELACPSAQELRVQRLEAVAAARARVADRETGLLELGEELAGRASGHDRFVVLEPLEERPAEQGVLILARGASEDFAVEVRVELGAAPAELAELLPAPLADERRREAQARRPAAGPCVDRVDRVLGEVKGEFAAEELDRLGAGERELRGGDVEHRSGKAPPWQTAQLRRPPGREDEVRGLGKELDELVRERSEPRAALERGMVVYEKDDLAQARQLVGEGLRQLRQPAVEPPSPLERGDKLRADLGMIPPQGADEVGIEDERILVAALQREPRHPLAGRAQEIRVLREQGGLPVSRRGVHEREPMPLRAREPLEEPLSTKERQREGRRGVTRAIGCAARGGQAR